MTLLSKFAAMGSANPLADVVIVESGGALGGSATAITFSRTIKQNDIVVLLVASINATFTVPAGYILGASGVIVSGYNWRWYYKVMGSVPDSGINLSDTNPDGSGFTFYVLRNADASNPILVSASNATNLPPSVSPATKCLVIAATFGGNNSTPAFSAPPAGYSGFLTVDATANSDADVASAFKYLQNGATETPGAFTVTSAFPSYASVSIAIRPATGNFPTWPIFVAAANTQNSVSSGSLTISKPAGTLPGHRMVAIMGADGNSGTWTGDTGWIEVADQGAAPDLRVAYKIAGASEPSSYTFTMSDPTRKLGGAILTYSGGDYEGIGSLLSGSGTLSPAGPTITTDYDIVIGAAFNTPNSVTISVPSDVNVRVRDNDASNGPSFVIVDRTAASNSAGTMTFSGMSAGSRGAVMLALKPV